MFKEFFRVVVGVLQVTPADVVSPSTLGPSVLIADIPSVAHLLSATSRPRPAPANGSGVTVAVHIVPREVATHPAFAGARWVHTGPCTCTPAETSAAAFLREG